MTDEEAAQVTISDVVVAQSIALAILFDQADPIAAADVGLDRDWANRIIESGVRAGAAMLGNHAGYQEALHAARP